MNEIQCPAEGCDYTGAKSSVKGHYSGMRDEAHEGGYLRAEDLLDGDSADTGNTDADPNPTTGTAKDPPDLQGEGQTASNAGKSGEPTCPECGGSRYFKPADYGVDMEHEYGCADCSTKESWVVFDA